MRKNHYSKLLELGVSKVQELSNHATPWSDAKERFTGRIARQAKVHAGVHSMDAMLELERRYHKTRTALPAKAASTPPGPRETLATTVRFRQAPGSSAIYGGRKAGTP